MKLILPLLFLPFFYSCQSVFQLATLNSPASAKNEARELVIKNDSLEFTYNFNKKRGPVQVRIENKYDHQVSIDWKRSALIVNNRSVSLAPAYMTANGTIDSIRRSSSGSGQLKVNIEVPREIEYIAPHSYLEKRLPASFIQKINDVPDASFVPITIKNYDGLVQKAREASFTADNSPLTFRGYFFMAVGDTAARTMVIQHSFYVSTFQELKAVRAPEMRADKHGDNFLVVERVTYVGR